MTDKNDVGNGHRTFYEATLTEAIHWLGKRGFSKDDIRRALASKDIAVTDAWLHSHIGCAKRGPKRGLKDRTNEHRQIIARFPREVQRRLLKFRSPKTARTQAARAA